MDGPIAINLWIWQSGPGEWSKKEKTRSLEEDIFRVGGSGCGGSYVNIHMYAIRKNREKISLEIEYCVKSRSIRDFNDWIKSNLLFD